MTLLYMVTSSPDEDGDYQVYIRTLDGVKANKLRDRLIDDYPEIQIMTFEIDSPVYYLDLEYPDGFTQFNVVCVGEPEDDDALTKVTIKRKERLV